jgi:hypothetical protein
MRYTNQKQLTFEQISKRYAMSISEVNAVINTAYNKMVHALAVDQKFDMWDVVVELKNFFNMTEKEAVDKLTREHREILKASAYMRADK